MKFIVRFFKMTKEEKVKAICRRVYRLLHKREFGELGKKSYIWKPMLVTNRKFIHIGSDCSIYPMARIECITKWGGQEFTPRLQIGNCCAFGQQLHMTCASSIIIGDNVTVSARVLITDINHSYQEIDLPSANQKLETRPVIIGSNSLIGINAAIMPGVKLGKNVVVGANAVVTSDVPDDCIVAGIPAKIIKRYDRTQNTWIKV